MDNVVNNGIHWRALGGGHTGLPPTVSYSHEQISTLHATIAADLVHLLHSDFTTVQHHKHDYQEQI